MASCTMISESGYLPDDMESNEDDAEIPVITGDLELFQKDIALHSVNDVYSIAASIGREFEKLTDAFGGAIFSDIMPKIIRVLEMLETNAARSQNRSTDVLELQAMVNQLQIEGKASAERHKEGLDMVENAWREETRQLLHSVEALQEDNSRLTQLLMEKPDAPEEMKSISDQQSPIAGVLSESIEKLKAKIREKDRVLEQQTAECEALSCQAQQVTKLNVNLRRKVALMEKQAASIASQNTNFESSCREKDRQIKELQKRVVELVAQAKCRISPANEPVMSEAPADPLLANKLVIDLNDPDRPRYTMHELQEVLDERNQYKLKCILLEDEISYYKQFAGANGKEDSSWEEIDNDAVDALPPMLEVNNNSNESNDKPDSVIKKLFAAIFTRNARSPAIPHEPRRPRLPSHLRYDIPLLDVSDVMPAIDVAPSPDEPGSLETPSPHGSQERKAVDDGKECERDLSDS